MAVTDITFAFSGIITFDNGDKGVVEAYYDRKGGSYSPDATEGLETDQQIVHANSGEWATNLNAFFVTAFNSALGLGRTADPDVPVPLRTINGGVLHVRGMLTEDNNDKTPISATYDVSQLDAVNNDGISHVGLAEMQKWDDEAWGTANAWQTLIEATLAQVIANASIQ